MKTKRNSQVLGRLLYSLLAGLLLGTAALAIFLIQDRLRTPAPGNNSAFQVDGAAAADGLLTINPPLEIADFELTDSYGESVRLDDFRGRYLMLTYGFTHCPDICPLTLSDFDRMQQLLGNAAEAIAFVFVSVDGKRDTPASLRQYFAFRDLDDIIALTGDESAVLKMGEPFGLSFEINDENQSGGYLINHTTGSFLLDEAGRWIRRYQFGLPPERIVADLRMLLDR